MVYSVMATILSRILRGAVPLSPRGANQTGLVVMADGVGGFDLCAAGLRRAAVRAALPYEVTTLRWGHGLGRWHADLSNVANQQAQAAALALLVENQRADHPGAPAFLIGKSGGTGVVVRALELLPAGAVEVAVLISSAVSPGYDLSQALRGTRRELVSFWSPLDCIVLGAGTRIFGTVDRVRGVSAGLVGFQPPVGADRTEYAKLRQVKWHPRMARTGHWGGHVGPDSPAFLRRYVLPLLTVAPPPEAEMGGRSSRPCPGSIR